MAGQGQSSVEKKQTELKERTGKTWFVIFAVPITALALFALGTHYLGQFLAQKVTTVLSQNFGLKLNYETVSLRVIPELQLILNGAEIQKSAGKSHSIEETSIKETTQPEANSNKDLHLSLESLNFVLDWKALLRRDLVVRQLHLHGLKMVQVQAPLLEPPQTLSAAESENVKNWEEHVASLESLLLQIPGAIDIQEVSVSDVDWLVQDSLGQTVLQFYMKGRVQTSLAFDAPQKSVPSEANQSRSPISDEKLLQSAHLKADLGLMIQPSTRISLQVPSTLSFDALVQGNLSFRVLREGPSGADFQFEVVPGQFEVTESDVHAVASKTALSWDLMKIQFFGVTEPQSAGSFLNRGVGNVESNIEHNVQESGADSNLMTSKSCGARLQRVTGQVVVSVLPCGVVLRLEGLKIDPMERIPAGVSEVGVQFVGILGQGLQIDEDLLKKLQSAQPSAWPEAFEQLEFPAVDVALEISHENRSLLRAGTLVNEISGQMNFRAKADLKTGRILSFLEQSDLLLAIVDADQQGVLKENRGLFQNSTVHATLGFGLTKAGFLNAFKGSDESEPAKILAMGLPFLDLRAALSTGESDLPFHLESGVDSSLDSGLSYSAHHAAAQGQTDGSLALLPFSNDGLSLRLLGGVSAQALQLQFNTAGKLNHMISTPQFSSPVQVAHFDLASRLRLSLKSGPSTDDSESSAVYREGSRLLKNSPLSLWANRPIHEFEASADFDARGITAAKTLNSGFPVQKLKRAKGSAHLAIDPRGSASLTQTRLILGDFLEKGENLGLDASSDRAAPLLEANLQGNLDATMTEGFVSGDLTFDSPEKFVFESTTFSGRAKFPFRVVFNQTAPQKQQVQLKSEVLFEKVDLLRTIQSDDPDGPRSIEVKGLSGKFPVDEQLTLIPIEGDALPYQIVWDPLLEDNPFRRADGQRLAGLYSASKNVSVSLLRFGQWEVGPLAAALSLKQNQLVLDSLDADLFGGTATGQASVNIQPSRLAVGFSGRMTQVSGAQILKITDLKPEDSALSARSAFTYNFDESVVNGRVDVERIPRPFLDRVLLRLDPDGKDSKIGTARKMLGVATPGRFGMVMHDGLVDVNLELLTLGGGVQDLRIPALPLTRFVEGKTANLRQSFESAVPDVPESQ